MINLGNNRLTKILNLLIVHNIIILWTITNLNTRFANKFRISVTFIENLLYIYMYNLKVVLSIFRTVFKIHDLFQVFPGNHEPCFGNSVLFYFKIFHLVETYRYIYRY